jgi:hypothetical protein
MTSQEAERIGKLLEASPYLTITNTLKSRTLPKASPYVLMVKDTFRSLEFIVTDEWSALQHKAKHDQFRTLYRNAANDA